MQSGLRRRFWLETICGSVTGIVAVITLFWHDWIEAVFRSDPDSGNGSAEWLVVLVLLVFAAMSRQIVGFLFPPPTREVHEARIPVVAGGAVGFLLLRALRKLIR